MPVSMSMHSKCPNTPCTGGQCRVRRLRTNTAAPRHSGPTKGEKRLAARQAAYQDAGKTRMHRPGSVKN